MTIGDELQKLKVAAACGALLVAVSVVFLAGLHFGILMASGMFAMLSVGALIGSVLTRWIG